METPGSPERKPSAGRFGWSFPLPPRGRSHATSRKSREKLVVPLLIPRAQRSFVFFAVGLIQGCGIKGLLPTSVIQGNPPSYEQNSRWEALSVVSQKWIPFPTALV